MTSAGYGGSEEEDEESPRWKHCGLSGSEDDDGCRWERDKERLR